jgi:hypothetical protein
MTTFTMQDLTPEQQVAINKHEEAHAMNSNINTINDLPVTKEEEEAMDALSRLATGRPLLDITPTTQDALNNLAIPQPDTTPTPPTLETIIANICAQLQLLTSVIKEGQEKGNSHAGTNVPSLQECVSTTLQQAEWFREAVDEKIAELVEDKDHTYEIESAVETHFSNNFCLDDHVDITAEVESKVEDIAEDLLRDMLDEKLRNLRITFD